MTTWCLIPNLGFYFLATLFYLALPFGKPLKIQEGRRYWLADVAFVLTIFGVLLHLVYLIYLAFHQQFSPLIFLSFGVVALFLWLMWRSRWQGLGSFFLPLALILFLFSLRSGATPFLFHEIPWLISLHVVLALLALVFMLGCFCLGLAFFIHERNLKGKKWGIFTFNLPPLVLNEKRALFWLKIGFLLLTLVLLSGSLLTLNLSFHVILALVAWMIYALVLNRRWTGLQGKNILLLSFMGFVSLISAYLWT